MKNHLPEMNYSTLPGRKGTWRRTHLILTTGFLVLLCLAWRMNLNLVENPLGRDRAVTNGIAARRAQVLEQCKYIKSPAGPPPDFNSRSQSDRFEPATRPTLLKNAKIITGAKNGTEILHGDVLLDKGLIKAVGDVPSSLIKNLDLEVVDVEGAWVSPGLVDLHSHIGVHSVPTLQGSADGNSHQAPILPWLRSIDALNTHDASYELAIAGGVTSAQILPGSANNIGGQAYVIKLRPTSERSSISKVIEPPYALNGTYFDHSLTPRWRHMKHACGENPSRVYGQTRMDSAWEFRKAYDQARKLKEAQDQICERAEAGVWGEIDSDGLPEDLQWEALVDVLRGKVKLSVHCYEAVDLDAIVRLSNEFKFPVASFHHAGQTYLVPDLLKKTWGGTPTIALFATNARKKREAYRNSEFAPRILADQDIPVVMKSDHPVVNSRYLLNEATMAHYYGLNSSLALASVTSTPAYALGLGHRIGSIKTGYDADVVIWDSHPLALGATPKQVYIDGIAQLDKPHVSAKSDKYQVVPETPNFDADAVDAVYYDGLPPLEPRRSKKVIFTNITSFYSDKSDILERVYSEPATAVVKDGVITCLGEGFQCQGLDGDGAEIIDLQGGSLCPGLTTFGSPIGLVEIRLEPSTNDGLVYDPLIDDVPSIIGGGEQSIIRAADGLQFGGRNTLLAYRGGVTTAVTAPSGKFLLGFSTAFSPGARHALEKHAIIQEETAVHIAISHDLGPGVSTQITALRNILFDAHLFSSSNYSLIKLELVREGAMPLVVHAESADIIATVINLKLAYERETRRSLHLTIAGGAEAHLLAEELGEHDINVVLTPSRPFPGKWEQRRILPGPPLSYHSAVAKLLKSGVNVAIGVEHEYTARNTRFDLAWAALESHGEITKAQTIALGTINLEKALGLVPPLQRDIVAYRGGDMWSKSGEVVGVISQQRGFVDVFD